MCDVAKVEVTSYTFIKSFCLPYQLISTSQPAINSNEFINVTFSYIKSYVAKFYLDVKKVKVNLGSSFKQTRMCPGPQCYLPTFMEIVNWPQKRFLRVFSNISVTVILVM